MVVNKSYVSYAEHRKNVLDRFTFMFGSQRANKFIEFYDSRYAHLGNNFRPFIDPLFAYWLFDDYNKVKKLGTQAYGVVGIGGSGKSTFLKNVLYFLDPKINNDFITTKLGNFAVKLKSIPSTNSMRSIGLDEPDSGHHFSSQEGVAFRNIVGKWRQQQLFFGICATDISDIPTYIFRKLNVLIFLPHWGTGYVFRDMPRKKQFILQEIKTHYQRTKGYNVFFEYAKKKPYGFQKISTTPSSPLDLMEGQAYLKSKRVDYEDDLDRFINLSQKSDVIIPKKSKFARDYTDIIQNLVRTMYDKGVSTKEISLQANVSVRAIQRYIAQYKREKKLKKNEKTTNDSTHARFDDIDVKTIQSSDDSKKQKNFLEGMEVSI